MLADAGEHYALCQFTLHGFPAVKMPDNWTAYDLAIDPGNQLLRVSVKTRKNGPKFKPNAWFVFDDRKVCDWMVFLFVENDRSIRSWIIPFDVVLNHANVPGENRKDPWERDLSKKKLSSSPLSAYENNWGMSRDPAA